MPKVLTIPSDLQGEVFLFFHYPKGIKTTMKNKQRKRQLSQLINAQQRDMNNNKVKMDKLPEWIKRKNSLKSANRRKASIKLMKAYVGLYDCRECIHGLVKSCVDTLPNGCEYFSDEVSGRRFIK